jgi:ATPase family associated with various cellular activities (AAA)
MPAMKEKEKLQVPGALAEIALHACIFFGDKDSEEGFAKSIQKFIKYKLQDLDPELYKKCSAYRPGGQSLFRAMGRRDPGHIQKSGNAHLIPILNSYVNLFRKEYPGEAKAYEMESAGARPARQDVPPAPQEVQPAAGTISFEDYIHFKSADFTGREWLFDKIDSLIYTGRPETFYQSAYLLIHGDPGIGKTAIMAQLTRNRGYVHHFNIQNDGLNTPVLFLNNISLQLVRKYNLSEALLLSGSSPGPVRLQNILKAVSQKLSGKDDRCVILVDAIDEVETQLHETQNTLFLPDILPEKIIFLLSSREPGQVRLPNSSRLEAIPILADSKENREDAGKYLKVIVTRQEIQDYLRRNTVDPEDFQSILLERSEANFIYLFHVIREISAGIFTTASPDELPQGLERYYEQHWRTIRGDDTRKWLDYRLPVLAVLTVAELPVDAQFIHLYSRINKTSDIIEALTTWGPFLHKQGNQYSLYHKSFRDFLLRKEHIAAEAFDLGLVRDEMLNRMKEVFL